MAMTRGTPLVATVAAVVKLTGQQGIGHITDSGDATPLTMTDLLTTASDYVYDKLDHAGIDPTALSNQEVYERSVAFHFLSILAENGLLIVDGESTVESAGRYQRKSDHYFATVQPKSTVDDMPGVGNSFLPKIGNVSKNARFTANTFYDDRQKRR